MDAGERIILDYAWKLILDTQAQERQVLKDAQERQRETFYYANKHYFDTRPIAPN